MPASIRRSPFGTAANHGGHAPCGSRALDPVKACPHRSNRAGTNRKDGRRPWMGVADQTSNTRWQMLVMAATVAPGFGGCDSSSGELSLA